MVRCRAQDGAPEKFIRWVATQETDDCILWPYGKSMGYGACEIEGFRMTASSAVCILVHGKRPAEHDAAHSCGVRLCVNPRHLRWATRSENSLDCILHGTDRRGEKNSLSKLTETEALSVYAAPETHKEVAEKYGISMTLVSFIKSGKRWGWLTSSEGVK